MTDWSQIDVRQCHDCGSSAIDPRCEAWPWLCTLCEDEFEKAAARDRELADRAQRKWEQSRGTPRRVGLLAVVRANAGHPDDERVADWQDRMEREDNRR